MPNPRQTHRYNESARRLEPIDYLDANNNGIPDTFENRPTITEILHEEDEKEPAQPPVAVNPRTGTAQADVVYVLKTARDHVQQQLEGLCTGIHVCTMNPRLAR